MKKYLSFFMIFIFFLIVGATLAKTFNIKPQFHFINNTKILGANLKPQGAKSNSIQTVNLLANKAEPNVVAVNKGEFVQFNSKDGKNHNMAQGNGNATQTHSHTQTGIESGIFGPGEGYKVQFNKVGTYDFHDHTNPDIFVTVIVSDSR